MDNTLPYENIVNKGLGRTLTKEEIYAVEMYMRYVCAVSPDDKEGYDTAIRDLIKGGTVQSFVNFSKQSLSYREATLAMEQMDRFRTATQFDDHFILR